jgi:hypothetical protein
MKNRLLPYITFMTGIILSGVAGFFSIIGLTTLFSGAYWSVVVMGTTLEISKLVSVSWLYHNWKRASRGLKAYLLSAILILMLVTSMGIFGYLSRAHIEQKVALSTGVGSDITVLQNDIKIKQDAIKDLDRQITVIDSSIDKMLEKGQAKDSLKASDNQKKKRDELVLKKNNLLKELTPLKTQMVKYESEYKKVESELGPIKYIAEWVYGPTDEKILDKTVRYVILILIVVFDPLAIFLLIAYNVSVKQRDYENLEYVEIGPIRRRKRRKRRRRKNRNP